MSIKFQIKDKVTNEHKTCCSFSIKCAKWNTSYIGESLNFATFFIGLKMSILLKHVLLFLVFFGSYSIWNHFRNRPSIEKIGLSKNGYIINYLKICSYFKYKVYSKFWDGSSTKFVLVSWKPIWFHALRNDKVSSCVY